MHHYASFRATLSLLQFNSPALLFSFFFSSTRSEVERFPEIFIQCVKFSNESQIYRRSGTPRFIANLMPSYIIPQYLVTHNYLILYKLSKKVEVSINPLGLSRILMLSDFHARYYDKCRYASAINVSGIYFIFISGN